MSIRIETRIKCHLQFRFRFFIKGIPPILLWGNILFLLLFVFICIWNIIFLTNQFIPIHFIKISFLPIIGSWLMFLPSQFNIRMTTCSILNQFLCDFGGNLIANLFQVFFRQFDIIWNES